MGMYDESWCNGCGKSQPYSADEEVYCGECAVFYANENPPAINKMIHYIELHITSLEQDLEEISNQMDELDMNSKDFNELDFEYNIKSGEITASRHLLSVAYDMMRETDER